MHSHGSKLLLLALIFSSILSGVGVQIWVDLTLHWRVVLRPGFVPISVGRMRRLRFLCLSSEGRVIKRSAATFFFMLLEFELTLEFLTDSAVALSTTSVALAIKPADAKRIVVALSFHGSSPASLLSRVSTTTLRKEVWLTH